MEAPSNARPALVARLMRLYLRSRLRGATRLTYMLAHRLESLQHVPVEIPGWSPVYLDLRLTSAHSILMESPYTGLWRELDEVSIMRRFVREGFVAYDIGANIGLHSILLSHLIGTQGQLHVFEPNAELLPALKHTIEQLGNATLHPVALSNKDAKSTLFVPPDNSVASLADWTVSSPVYSTDGAAHAVACEERQMDNLIEEEKLPLPDFIKCDVEGAEILVFEGGRKTLNRVDAPLILFEANECASNAFNVDVAAAKDFLASLDAPRYSFFEVQRGGELTPLREVTGSFLNILAVPQSKKFLLDKTN